MDNPAVTWTPPKNICLKPDSSSNRKTGFWLKVAGRAWLPENTLAYITVMSLVLVSRICILTNGHTQFLGTLSAPQNSCLFVCCQSDCTI